jgi:hypothetical protein
MRTVRQNTIALNSYLGLTPLCKNFSGNIWSDKEGNSARNSASKIPLERKSEGLSEGRLVASLTFWTQSENSLESLNFFASTKPDKHKTKSKDFSIYNLTKFVFEYFHDSRRLASFAKFCLKSLFATWSYLYRTVTIGWYAPSSALSRSPRSAAHVLWHDTSLQTPPPIRCSSCVFKVVRSPHEDKMSQVNAWSVLARGRIL